MRLFELHFHIPKQFYFLPSDSEIIDHGNPDNNLESPCSTVAVYRVMTR
jgi:hypothetical protein